MVETLDWLIVDVGDQVVHPETRVIRRTPLVHFHDKVVVREKVRVPEVDPDGSQRESVASGAPTDDDWRFEGIY